MKTVKSEERKNTEARLIIEERCYDLLKAVDVEKLEKQYGPGRPRLVGAVLFWSGVYSAIIHSEEWLMDIWRHISVTGVWGHGQVEVKDEAIYKRIKGNSWETARELFYTISEKTKQRDNQYQKIKAVDYAKNIYVMDDTVLDKVAKKAKRLRGQKDTVLGGRYQHYMM